ncbi:hypothetical protein CHUAL_003945 [Chamberlinius hualienensis]
MSASVLKPIAVAENYVLRDFYFISVLARVFGFFPFSTLGSRLTSVSELKMVRLKVDIVATTVVLFSMFCFNFGYNRDWPNFVFNNIRVLAHHSYVFSYRAASKFMMLYIVIFKSKPIVSFMRQVCHSELANDNWREKCKNLNRLGKFLVALCICNLIIYLIICNWYIPYDLFSSWMEMVITVLGLAGILYSYNFVSSFVIYFSCYFKWRFKGVNESLNGLSKFQQNGHQIAIELSVIRQRHELLITLVEKFNDIMSPSLLIYSMAELSALCVNMYELCVHAIENSHYGIIALDISFAIIRLLPVVLVCLSGNALSNSACCGVKYFDKFIQRSEECEFQASMLFDQFQNRKVKVTASDIFNIDHQLLAKAVGIIVTYIVFMVEFNLGNRCD